MKKPQQVWSLKTLVSLQPGCHAADSSVVTGTERAGRCSLGRGCFASLFRGRSGHAAGSEFRDWGF